jgi:hypothetical protein
MPEVPYHIADPRTKTTAKEGPLDQAHQPNQPRSQKVMAKWNHMAWIVQCACSIYLAAVAQAGAAAPDPKLLACLNSCDEALMACVQPPLQKPAVQRTIKDFNIIRACSGIERSCDRRCRGK